MRALIFALGMVMIASCTSTKPSVNNAAAGPKTTANQVTPQTSNLTLADYLKRIPGVQVIEGGSGYVTINVRGANTLGDNKEPLFIINGANAGNSYEKASSMVDINDIDLVQVLKSGQETAAYGMQGSNGVIVIKTKRRN